MISKAFIGAAAFAVAAASPAFADGPNLVTNGDFEGVSAGAPASFEINYAGTVNDWTSSVSNTNNSGIAYNLLFDSATAGTVDAVTRFGGEQQRMNENYPGASPTGGNFVMLDGDSGYNGYLSQAISGLTVGKTYKLTFSWAGTQMSNRTGPTTEYIAVGFGNSATFDPLTQAAFTTNTVAGDTHYFSGWFTETTRLKATSASQVLSFLSVGTPAGLPPVALLDGVSLNAVPEPASWALMLFGFGGLGFAARRRRGQVTSVTA